MSSSAGMQDLNQGLWNRISSRLNARWQTDWAIEDQTKNLNSTARPYDERAFSPLDPLPYGFHTWLWRYTCLLLLVSTNQHRNSTHQHAGHVVKFKLYTYIREMINNKETYLRRNLHNAIEASYLKDLNIYNKKYSRQICNISQPACS